jgi:O-antigen ligase
VSIALLIFGRYSQLERIFLILHSLLLTIALLFTFTRSAWVASSIAIVLMLPFVLLAYRHFLLRILLLGGATILFLLGSAGLLYENSRIEQKAAQGIVERFNTIFTVEDTLETNSLQWRLFESQEARKALSENFWTGVGLGNSYRPITVFQGEAQGAWTDNDISDERIDRFTRYVHTSYLALAVKLGVPALILLLCFVGLSILKGFSMFMTLANGAPRGIVLAVSVGLIGLLQWSILHAHLMLASSTAVVGLVIGIIASIHTIYIRNTTPNIVAT